MVNTSTWLFHLSSCVPRKWGFLQLCWLVFPYMELGHLSEYLPITSHEGLIHCKASYYGMDDHTIYTIFWPRHISGSPKFDDFNICVVYIYMYIHTHTIFLRSCPPYCCLDFFLPRIILCRSTCSEQRLALKKHGPRSRRRWITCDGLAVPSNIHPLPGGVPWWNHGCTRPGND